MRDCVHFVWDSRINFFRMPLECLTNQLHAIFTLIEGMNTYLNISIIEMTWMGNNLAASLRIIHLIEPDMQSYSQLFLLQFDSDKIRRCVVHNRVLSHLFFHR